MWAAILFSPLKLFSHEKERERENEWEGKREREKERKPLRSTSNTKEKLLSNATSNNGKVTSLFLGRAYYFRYETRLEISNRFIDEADPRRRLLSMAVALEFTYVRRFLISRSLSSECSIQSFQQQVVDCFLRCLVHGSFSRL